MMDFQQAYAGFQQLKQQLDSGQLSEDDFKARLRDLMLQDADGTWWMIGQDTGQWYRHDGTDWLRDDPPALSPSKPVRGQPARVVDPAATPRLAVNTGSIKARPEWIAVLWIALGWAASAGAVAVLLVMLGAPLEYWTHKSVAYFIWYVDNGDGGVPAFASMLMLGSLAGLITAMALRSQGVISNWKVILSITLAWAICLALSAARDWMLPLTGALGGLAMALILRFTGVLSDWKDLLWIALSGALPWLPSALQQGGALGLSLLLLLAGAAIAAFILVWRLRAANRPQQ